MSEGHELAEKVIEAGHGGHESALDDTHFRRRVGLLIGILACLLAITSVGGSNMMKRTINANIETSDTYAFYQAKVIRQQVLQTASDELNAIRQLAPNLPPDAVSFVADRQAAYAKSISHWESAPETGDGKKELLDKAKLLAVKRDEASDRDEWFEIAEGLLQISVVIASTAVLTLSRPILLFCLVIAALGVAGSLNAFLGLVPLPF